MGIKENILERIKNEKIIPISRYKIIQKYFLTGLFFTLILAGGVFLVSFFISGTLEIAELIEIETITLMSVWILLIITIGALAYIELKDFGKIYKYGISKILLYIFITLFSGGCIIYFTGIGKDIQTFLIRHTSYEKVMLVYTNWNNPSSGRLIGEIVKMKKGIVYIKNLDDEIWKIRISRALFDTLDSAGERIFEEGNTLKFTGGLRADHEFIADTASLIFE